MANERQRRLPWGKLVGLTFFAISFGMGVNTLDPALLGFRILDFAPDRKNTALGILTGAGLLVALLTQPLIGAVSDRTRSPLGRRIPYFVMGSALAVGCLYAVALAPSLTLLALGAMAFQAGSNAAQGPWQALLPDQVPAAQRGLASGLKALFEILAFTAGRSISGYLIAQGDMMLAVSAAALAYAIGLLVTTLSAWGERDRSGQTEAAQPESWLKGSKALLLGSGFHWWFINRGLFWSGVIALNTFILFYLMDVIGMHFENASRFFGDLSLVLGLGVLVVAVPAGRLADRVGRRPIVIAAGLMAALGSGLLLLVRSQPGLILTGALLGLAVGMWLSANWALLTDIVPQQRPALYLGIANIAMAGGSLVSRFGGALIIDPINRLTDSQANGYLGLYGLAMVAFLLATLAVLRLPDQGRDASRRSDRDARLAV